MEDKPEPYVPYGFGPPIDTPGCCIYRSYRYQNYSGVEYPWPMYAVGDDELAAFMDAMKHLNKLKRKADKRREKKEQA